MNYEQPNELNLFVANLLNSENKKLPNLEEGVTNLEVPKTLIFLQKGWQWKTRYPTGMRICSEQPGWFVQQNNCPNKENKTN